MNARGMAAKATVVAALCLLAAALAGCSTPHDTPSPTLKLTPTKTAAPTATATVTPTPTVEPAVAQASDGGEDPVVDLDVLGDLDDEPVRTLRDGKVAQEVRAGEPDEEPATLRDLLEVRPTEGRTQHMRCGPLVLELGPRARAERFEVRRAERQLVGERPHPVREDALTADQHGLVSDLLIPLAARALGDGRVDRSAQLRLGLPPRLVSHVNNDTTHS